MVGTGRKRGRPVEDRISEAQQRTLKELSAFVSRTGYPPTMNELGDVLGITAASAHNLVRQLERKGFVRREPRKPRSLQVVREPEQVLGTLLPPISHAIRTPSPARGSGKQHPGMCEGKPRLGPLLIDVAPVAGENEYEDVFPNPREWPFHADPAGPSADIQVLHQRETSRQRHVYDLVLPFRIRRYHIVSFARTCECADPALDLGDGPGIPHCRLFRDALDESRDRTIHPSRKHPNSSISRSWARTVATVSRTMGNYA